MQSWGITSRFTERDTGMEPSKSGVLGLICAALGKPRNESTHEVGVYPSLSSLTALRMGVRIDSAGKLGVDFQSAGAGRLGSRAYGVAKANKNTPEPVLSWRYFLQDAIFLVGLEGSSEILARIHSALKCPVWPICLGRKSYVPSATPYLEDGLQNGGLEEVFCRYPLLTGEESPSRVRIVLDDINGREQRIDVPLDYSLRRFGPRYVKTSLISCPTNVFV